jgi:hypothetical protein
VAPLGGIDQKAPTAKSGIQPEPAIVLFNLALIDEANESTATLTGCKNADSDVFASFSKSPPDNPNV